ncbi:MAG: reprolysin-like metallopeptidase, partial [Pseudomonadota bacterium]
MCTICSLNPLNEFNGGHEIVTNPTSIGESSGEILGSTSYSFVGATSDQNTNGLLSGYKWTSTTLTYSFPNSINDYGSSDAAFHGSSFSQFDAAQQAATKYWLDEFASVSGLTFIEYTGGLDDDAVLKFANGNASTAFAYYPNSTARAGDSWYGPFTQDPIMGNYDWHTLGHEIGHTVGLKHGHETNVFGAMQYAYDSNEYSIMTYRSYVGHAADFYELGSTSGAQSLMVYDIAALQHMYGANYSTNSGNTTYQFSTSTGQLY